MKLISPLSSTDLESFLKVAMLFQKRSKVYDNLRSCDPQIQNAIIYSFGGLKTWTEKYESWKLSKTDLGISFSQCLYM